MGLIYVNPRRSERRAGRVASGRDVRETFGRMAMNDYETGSRWWPAATPSQVPRRGRSEAGGPRGRKPPPSRKWAWAGRTPLGTGKGETPPPAASRAHGPRIPSSGTWATFDMLFGYDWNLVKSPAGAWQWVPVNVADKDLAPAAHDPAKRVTTIMTTADLSLRMDSIYAPIARHFHEHPEEFADAFARAWFKLTHRDMGPRSRYLGPEVPAEELIWQDPVPAVDHLWSTPRTSRSSRQRSSPRACRRRSWCRLPGPRPPPSAARTSVAAPTVRASDWRPEGLEGQPARAAGEGAGHPRRDPKRLHFAQSGGRRSRWRT